MAGPGGGPPRKSHTKSRKGCKTCKKRHIRCDEFFPQCRNCTKHSCRCDYMDSPSMADDVPRGPPEPDLMWTPTIEAEIDAWLRTRNCPFPELALNTHIPFHGLSKIDLRLVHHLCSTYRQIQCLEMLHCIAWVEKLPVFLDIADRYSYVMSAILAFSATHLAWLTKCTETTNIAYHYRGIALNGLQGAIGNFSEENSDPILAASILLSWQASDWNGWVSLMQGISTVVSSMDAWKDTSRLASYVQSHVVPQPEVFLQPQMGSLGSLVLPEDDASLQEAIHTLQSLQEHIPAKHPLRRVVEEICNSAEQINVYYNSMPAQQLFDKLQEFRARLLWMPISLVQGAENSRLSFLIVAHLYAVGLSIDNSIPELNGAAFGKMVAAPIEELDRRLKYNQSPIPQQGFGSTRLEGMMHFPRQMAAKAHYKTHSFSQVSDALPSGRQSPYGFQNLRLDSPHHSPPGFPGTFSAVNRSTGDLSVPPSPFLLQNYNTSPRSRRPSLSFEQHSRSGSMNINIDRKAFGAQGGSPAYSPAYSPALTLSEDDYRFSFGETSTGYNSGLVSPSIWT